MIQAKDDILKVNGKGFRCTNNQFVFEDGIAQVYNLIPTSRPKKGIIRMDSYVMEYLGKYTVVLAPYTLEKTDFDALAHNGYISGIHTIPCKGMSDSLETLALMN